MTLGLNDGCIVMSKPPYAYSIAGLLPSFARSLRCVTNIGTRVPSLLLKNTRSVTSCVGSNVRRGGLNGLLAFVLASYAYTVLGDVGELNE